MPQHGFIPLLQRAKNNGLGLRITLVSGVSLEIRVGAVGIDVVTGESISPPECGVIVPYSSLSVLETLWGDNTLAVQKVGLLRTGERPVSPPSPTIRLVAVVENSKRLSHTVTLHLPSLKVAGRVLSLGDGVVEIAGREGIRRTVSLGSVVWISVH
jgi:hypothetical protein